MRSVRDQVRNMEKVGPRPYAHRIANECQPKDKHADTYTNAVAWLEQGSQDVV